LANERHEAPNARGHGRPMLHGFVLDPRSLSGKQASLGIARGRASPPSRMLRRNRARAGA
jgi:hypothetical protein